MPMVHSGQYPIEYYYPGLGTGPNYNLSGFGPTAENCRFTWTDSGRTFGRKPIHERQHVGKCIDIRVEANYTRCLDSVVGGTYDPPFTGADEIPMQCCPTASGPIKYAIIGGEFPPSLLLDIDTGNMTGQIDTLQEINPNRFGFVQRKEFTEIDYLDGSVGGGKVFFTIRAFDSGNTSDYSDREFVFHIRTNWALRRDSMLLNMNNQSYLDSMKEQGFFVGPGCDEYEEDIF